MTAPPIANVRAVTLSVTALSVFSLASAVAESLSPGGSLKSVAAKTDPVVAPVEEVAPPALEVNLRSFYTFESDFEDRFANDTAMSTVNLEGEIIGRVPLNDNGWYFTGGLFYGALLNSDTSAPIPSTFQRANGVLGVEWYKGKARFPKFLITTRPGFFFETDIDAGDFDFPTLALYGFDITESLRLYVGGRTSILREAPFIPFGGFLWEPAPWFIVQAAYPQSGIFISPSRKLTLFAGAEVTFLTLRTDDGDDLPPGLNDALVDYDEFRAVTGFIYRPTDTMDISVRGGWSIRRSWDYYRAEVGLEQEGAPTVAASLTLKF